MSRSVDTVCVCVCVHVVNNQSQTFLCLFVAQLLHSSSTISKIAAAMTHFCGLCRSIS